MKSNIKLIVAIIVVLIIGLLAIFITFQIGNKKSFTSYTSSGYDVSGTWYSDQLNQDTLVLNKDGNYSSSSWIASGTYTVKNDHIILTDSYDTVYELPVLESDNVHMVMYQENELLHHYYRTQQEVSDSLGGEDPKDEQMTALYRGAVKQILTASAWAGDNSSINFTDTEIQYQQNGVLKTYAYEVKDVSAKDGTYTASIAIENQKLIVLSITENESDYLLSSSFFGTLTFKASNNVAFTQ